MSLGEYVLVVASSWSVATVAFNAFYLDGLVEAYGWWGRAGMALVTVCVLVAALFAAGARRDRLAVGAVGYIALLAVLVAVAMACSTGESVYEDAEGNYLFFCLVVAGSATGCYLLSRTLTGCVAWFVAAALVCSVVQAFYQSEELALSVLACATALALVVHKNFKLGLEQAQVANAPTRAGAFVSSVVPVAVVVACALAVWFGVIAPLSPGVLDVNLLTDYRSLPLDELKGTADEQPQLSFDYTSDNLTEGDAYTTDDLVRDPSSSVIIDAVSLLQQRLEEQLADDEDSEGAAGGSSGGGEEDSLDEDSLDEEYDALSYSEVFAWAWVAVLAALLVLALAIGYFVGRRVARRLRLRRLLALPPSQQVQQLYRFLLTRLGRLGLKPPVGMTLTQWAHGSARSMEVLDAVTHVPFTRLTDTYVACVYGDREPTEDDVVPFAVYYLNFWRAAREQLGSFRYFFKSFRL